MNNDNWEALDGKVNVYVNEEMFNGINEDARNFKITKPSGSVNLNKLCNLIIYNYLEQYIERINHRAEVVYEILQSNGISPDDGKLMDMAKEIAYTDIVAASPSYGSKKRVLSLVIDRDKRATVKEAIFKSFKDIQISVFLRGLIGSYLDLPVYQRELIVYADRIRKIETAIEQHEAVRYKNRESGKIPQFFPSMIEHSKHEYFNYVVGQFDNDRHSTAPVRLANMDDLVLTGVSAVFTDDFETMKEKMLRNGIQFAIQDDQVHTVTLTPDGYRNFEKRYLERPEPLTTVFNEDGTVTLTFDCSMFQLEAYFCPFKDNIEIYEVVE